MLTGGTDTHLVLLDLRGSELTGRQAEDRLAEIGITANRNTVPFDERPPTVASGVRFGTPAATMRGLDEADCARGRRGRRERRAAAAGPAAAGGAHPGDPRAASALPRPRARATRCAMSSPDPRVVEVAHPLVRHKLTLLRDRSTDTRDFRGLVHELALLVCYEATRTLETEPCEVETPLERAEGVRVPPSRVTVVPVLRAGLGMLDAVLALIPAARVGFLGRLPRRGDPAGRARTTPKLPFQIEGGDALLLDPMLATGGSASHSITVCKEAGARDVRLLSLIAAPGGHRARAGRAPRRARSTRAGIDRGLDENGYIRPGLGDAGDRLYGNP